MERRSFLGAILGCAVARPALAKLASDPRDSKPFVNEFSGWISPSASDSIFVDYWIWDSVRLDPGKIVDESLFGEPYPERFSVHSIGVQTESCDAKAFQDLFLSFEQGAKIWAVVPLHILGLFPLGQRSYESWYRIHGDLPLDAALKPKYRLISGDKPFAATAPCTLMVHYQGIAQIPKSAALASVNAQSSAK